MIPSFQQDAVTHPLLVIDYQRVANGDEQEIDVLWHAATKLGFWYLKVHGADDEVDEMFEKARGWGTHFTSVDLSEMHRTL
ncbi:hypothetical protein PUNSTDRAFT_107326 [Punctularia strigosozonata HHB-11173 SS5]|uniref:uncharacterized protein n=1 Tax=Punctularia strigosozonata (strain HHB-11173) TaxID=741275 RepID=UPI0004416961|nr:uncharacterized protein PUNSTDRAFT_107326 [Punctularia strigosozonata HHB-11173 SS5]EIN05626.1 hypothetical protein PUNSTDRAFT_107326 [Punctularia strigosozonata HHB-11173 SS5]